MTKVILFILLVYLSSESVAQKGLFEITVEQDGTIVTPGFTGDVLLNKSVFKIVVRLTKLEGVYLFASFKDSIYKSNDNDEIPGFDVLPSMVMAENTYNPDQEMIMNDEGWAYWYYNPKDDSYRFDKEIYKEGEMITGTKTIRQFYDYSSGKQVNIRDVGGPLYLFFFSAEQDKNHNLTKDLQRFKLKINWK